MTTAEINLGESSGVAVAGIDPEHPVASLIRSRGFGGLSVQVGQGKDNLAKFMAGRCRFSKVVCIDPFQEREMDERVTGESRHVSMEATVYWNPPSGRCPGFLSYLRVGVDSVKTEASRLDEIAAGYGRIDLLCVDVENHEIEVLRSASLTITRDKPEICVRAGAGSWELMDALLAPCGYRLMKRFPGAYNYYVPDAMWLSWVSMRTRFLPTALARRIEGLARRSSMLARSLVRWSRPFRKPVS